MTKDQQNNVNNMVTELISGKYVQERGAMKRVWGDDDARYCCLGVAAEAVLGVTFEITGIESCTYNGSSFGTLLPEDAEKFNFNAHVNPVEQERAHKIVQALGHKVNMDAAETRQHVLVRVNDAGVPFNLIAAFILAMGWNKE